MCTICILFSNLTIQEHRVCVKGPHQTIQRLQEFYLAGTPPPVLKFLDPPLLLLHQYYFFHQSLLSLHIFICLFTTFLKPPSPNNIHACRVCFWPLQKCQFVKMLRKSQREGKITSWKGILLKEEEKITQILFT